MNSLELDLIDNELIFVIVIVMINKGDVEGEGECDRI